MSWFQEAIFRSCKLNFQIGVMRGDTVDRWVGLLVSRGVAIGSPVHDTTKIDSASANTSNYSLRYSTIRIEKMTVDFDVKGKVIALTGAASGIGLETAKLLAAQGCKLSIADVNPTALEEKAKEIAACAHRWQI